MNGANNGAAAPQAPTSHMMQTTKRGRPFLKDTLDLFATLIVSLDLGPRKQFFRIYDNCFSTDEAALNLAALKFSQSNRGPDPRDPSRVVTTTTTTTFSMTRDMAKAMCQHFMDARLIENAADRSSNLFKDRSVYVLTPKGLHVLERFISKNGISAEPFARVFSSQPICLKLLHLERRSSDDEIIVSQSVVTSLFRRFAGRYVNMVQSGETLDFSTDYHQRSKGIPLTDVMEKSSSGGLMGNSKTSTTWRYCFQAVTALEWLCDFTSIVGRDEAAEMAAHFVRFGFIALVSDKRKGNDSAIIFTVRGSAPGGNSKVQQQGEFRCTAKAIYRITEEGRRVARWDVPSGRSGRDSPNASSANVSKSEHRSLETDGEHSGKHSGPSGLHKATSASDGLKGNADGANGKSQQKGSNTDRLKFILEDPTLRTAFRDFLAANFCEENLAFYLDVEDFKRKFNITSSAIAANPYTGRPYGVRNTPGQAAMEKHHESLIQMAFEIYNTYLAPSSKCELNIDHGLRNELVAYLSDVIADLTGKSLTGRVEPEQASALNATQLQTMIRLYDRIQMHVFRLMATDSVPKFVKTSEQASKHLQDDYDNTDDETIDSNESNPILPPGLDEEESSGVGGTYMTISTQANEQVQRARFLQQQRGTNRSS